MQNAARHVKRCYSLFYKSKYRDVRNGVHEKSTHLKLSRFIFSPMGNCGMKPLSRKDELPTVAGVQARILSKQQYLRSLRNIDTSNVDDPNGEYLRQRAQIQSRIEIAEKNLQELDAKYLRTPDVIAQLELELEQLQGKLVIAENAADILKFQELVRLTSQGSVSNEQQ